MPGTVLSALQILTYWWPSFPFSLLELRVVLVSYSTFLGARRWGWVLPTPNWDTAKFSFFSSLEAQAFCLPTPHLAVVSMLPQWLKSSSWLTLFFYYSLPTLTHTPALILSDSDIHRVTHPPSRFLSSRDFPGGLPVITLHSQRREHEFNPWSEN